MTTENKEDSYEKSSKRKQSAKRPYRVASDVNVMRYALSADCYSFKLIPQRRSATMAYTDMASTR